MPALIEDDDEKIKKVIESTASEVSHRTKDEIIKELETGENKISKMLKNAIPAEKQAERIEKDKEREKLEKQLEESEVPCPSCSSSEHKHLLKVIGNGKMECTGEGCKSKYIIVPENADHKCEGCGLPKKKPLVEVKDDNCPFCGGDKFKKFDWEKFKQNLIRK